MQPTPARVRKITEVVVYCLKIKITNFLKFNLRIFGFMLSLNKVPFWYKNNETIARIIRDFSPLSLPKCVWSSVGS